MKIDCFKIGHDLQLTSCEYEHAVEAARNPDAKVWLDVQGAKTAQLEALLDKLEVKNLARRLCIDARERSGFYPLNAFVLLVFPVQPAPEHSRKVENITVLARKNLLLTLRAQRDSPLQQVTTVEESADWRHDGTIAGLVSTLLMVLSLDSCRQLSDLRDQIWELEKRMEREPEGVDISEISETRSKLLTLEAVVNGQLPAFPALMATNEPFFELENSREHLMSAFANLQAADRSLHWLEGRIDVIRSHAEMRVQHKMNRRLSRLTILSTIFMPITFLAGIWGMNFQNMPLLSQPYGYLVAIGVMLLVGGGVFFYFMKKGWFE